MNFATRLRLIALVGTALFGSGSATAQSCFESDFGSWIGDGDDVVYPIQSIGFALPMGATSYSDLHISSNGFLYLSNGGVPAPGDAGCCAGVGSMFAQNQPRVAAWWCDLKINPPGGVYLNRLIAPRRTVITWDRVREFSTAPDMVVQVQLFSDGRIETYFSAAAQARSSNAVLIGVSVGGGLDPLASDLSAGVSTTVPIVYEVFDNAARPFDLAAGSVSFVPNAGGGYDTAFAACIPATSYEYGSGCPGPCAGYELFTQGIDLSGAGIHMSPNGNGGYVINNCVPCFDPNIGADLVLGDDALAVGLNLGFQFPYCNTSTATIDVCSNGFVWLQTGVTTSTDPSESIAEFLAQSDRIAVVWNDFAPNQSGSVHFNALPGSALITWNGVTEPGAGNSSTFQLQLFPDGTCVIACPNLDAQTGLTGWVGGSPGAGLALDLGTNPQDTGASGVPMSHRMAAGARPVLGRTFHMEFDDFPAGVGAVAWLIGFDQLAIPLGPLGAPGCFLYHSNDLNWSGTAWSGGVLVGPFVAPSDPRLVGITLQSQGVALVSGINRLGIVSSNAVSMTFSTF